VIVPPCCLNTTKHRVRKDPVDPLLSGQYLLFCLIKLVPLMQALYKLFALVQRNTTTILVKAFIEPLNKASASIATDPSSQHMRSSSNTRSHHSLTRRLAQLDWVSPRTTRRKGLDHWPDREQCPLRRCRADDRYTRPGSRLHPSGRSVSR
jgi:hypothetical protein